jgi:drug/metabolite transporter (DMT)-like permease
LSPPSAPAGARTGSNLLPILALTLNAAVWGTSWWPFRHLQSHGLHPLFATAAIYVGCTLVILLVRPRAALQLARTPALWLVLLASGITNAAFNWAVVLGDVVRVVLLFYLMPLWAVLLARLLLGERLTPMAGLRVALGLAGAAVVLWPAPSASGAGGWPLPQSLSDWLGVLGGFSFAFNNVMLRRESARPQEGRALAMFMGGAVVAGIVASTLALQGAAPWPALSIADPWTPVVALGLGLSFLVGNLSLQYGAARLPANLTAVVMLAEVLFAATSSAAFGGGAVTASLVVGGALIVGGAMLAELGGGVEARPRDVGPP